MRITVHGGTAENGQSSLCHTCRHATVVRGARLRDEIVECAALSYQREQNHIPGGELQRLRQPSASQPARDGRPHGFCAPTRSADVWDLSPRRI